MAVQQFFDANGNPLSSGKVSFYIPGTLTSKMVWQDANQTVPWTQPITLNAAGRPPGDKGIYGNGTYRQIVKSSSNATIWDQPTAAVGTGGGAGTNVGDGNSVGTILTWSGLIAPNQYQFAYGQSLSRVSFPELFQAITLLSNVTCIGGDPILTGIIDTSNLPVGAAVEGNCIATGSVITSKTLNTVTLSIPATISVATSARFFPYGNGDGSLTYTVPDLRGKVIPGRTNMGGIVSSNLTSTYCGSNPDAVGANCGNQSKILLRTHLPNITFSSGSLSAVTTLNNNTNVLRMNSINATLNGNGSLDVLRTTGIDGIYTITASTAISGTIPTGGSDTPISVIQPSLTLNYVIKVTPDVSVSGLFGVASIGGMQGIIACGPGLTCVGNIISAISSNNAGGLNTQVQYNNSGTLAGNSCFIWVSPSLTVGGTGCTGQLKLGGTTSGFLTQTVGSIAGNPIITWGNVSGTPAVTASAPLVLNTTTGNLTISGSALTKADDTNVTLTLGGTPASALLSSTSLTLGWTGTLAAGRLNSNVVQSVVNDTNVTGSISAQAMTLGWTGNLAVGRGGTGTNTFTANAPILGNGTSPLIQGSRSGNTTVFGTINGSLVPDNCIKSDINGNLVDAGVCGGGGVTLPFINGSDYAFTCNATVDNTALLQSAVTAATGKVLYLPTGCNVLISSPGIVIPANTTIYGYNFKTTNTSNHFVHWTLASNVSVFGITCQGARSGNVYTPDGVCFEISGTRNTAAPPTFISNVLVQDTQAFDMGAYGIRSYAASKFRFLNNSYSRIGYAGIEMTSCSGGYIAGNRIVTVRPGSGASMYGIALTRYTGSLTEDPRCEFTTAANNHIEDNDWEGLDTHAGRYLKFIGNTVVNTKICIANTHDGTNGAIGTSIIGNTCFGDYRGYAINAVGLSASNNFDTIISGNTMFGWGGSGFLGCIYAAYTVNLQIVGNNMDKCSNWGIYLDLNNNGYNISSNGIKDVGGSSNGRAIIVDAANNVGTIGSNTLLRLDTGWNTVVMDYGIYLSGSSGQSTFLNANVNNALTKISGGGTIQYGCTGASTC